MDRSGVAVRSPDGNLTGPHRAWVEDGRFRVANAAGEVLVDIEGEVAQESRTQAWVDTPEGRWHVKDLCGCSSVLRQWQREWRQAMAATA